MADLISVPTGRRPLTAQVSLDSFALQEPARAGSMVVVSHYPPSPRVPDGARVLHLLGATKSVAHNAALADHRERRGADPEVWFLLDDDVVLGQGTLDALRRVLEADESIGLLGAWNCAAQRARGQVREVAGEEVQYGDDFCVGGAVWAIPRRAITRVGILDDSLARTVDSEYTTRTRASGMAAAIVRSRFAVHLRDDGVDPGYVEERMRLHAQAVRKLRGDPV